MSRLGPKEMQRRALRKGGASLSDAIIEADAHPDKAASAPGPQQLLRPERHLEPGNTEAAGAASIEAQLEPIKPLVTADFFAEIARALRSYRHRRTKAREKMRRKRRAHVPGHTEEERR
jgi:hypothetical protein